jgi:hypothetical protein
MPYATKLVNVIHYILCRKRRSVSPAVHAGVAAGARLEAA